MGDSLLRTVFTSSADEIFNKLEIANNSEKRDLFASLFKNAIRTKDLFDDDTGWRYVKASEKRRECAIYFLGDFGSSICSIVDIYGNYHLSILPKEDSVEDIVEIKYPIKLN